MFKFQEIKNEELNGAAGDFIIGFGVGAGTIIIGGIILT
jgi:hypothetical protein